MACLLSVLLFSLLPLTFGQDDPDSNTIGTSITAFSNGQYQTERFKYIGCMLADLGSFTGPGSTSGFTQTEDSETMYLNLCIGNCYNYNYAVVYNTQCFCSSSPTAIESLSPSSNETCNKQCPGSSSQNCGGNGQTTDQDDGVALTYVTVYQNTAFVAPGTNPAEIPVPRDNTDSSALLIVPEGVKPTASPSTLAAQAYGAVAATAISARYTTLCTPPMCPTPYLSEMVTTIFMLRTYTQPSEALTVPMSMMEVGHSANDGGAGSVAATSTEVSVPDESAIAEIEGKVEEWISSQADAQVVLGEESSDEVDAVTEEAWLEGDWTDVMGGSGDGNSGMGSEGASSGMTDRAPILEKSSLLDLDRRREEAKRRLLEGMNVEKELGTPELHNPHVERDGGEEKRRQSFSPFAQAMLVENKYDPVVFFDEDEEDADYGHWDDDEFGESLTDYLAKRNASPEDTSDGNNSDDDSIHNAPTAPENALLGDPLISNPKESTPISVNKTQGIVQAKRHVLAKRQSPEEISAASAPSSSYYLTDGGVRTIGLDSTPSNSSTALYPMGNATISCPTGTCSSLPSSTTGLGVSPPATGLPTQVNGAKPSIAHPLAKPGKLLKHALAALCLMAGVLITV